MGISERFRILLKELAEQSGVVPKAGADLDATATTIIERRGASSTLDLGTTRRRFIVSAPPNQRFAGPNVQASLRRVEGCFQPDIVRSDGAAEAKVLLLTGKEAVILKESYRALHVEEDVRFGLPRSPLIPEVVPISVPHAGARSLEVRVHAGGAPVARADVVLLPRGGGVADGYKARTDADGVARFAVRPADDAFRRVIVKPSGTHWSRVLRDVPFRPQLDVELTPLTPNGFDWGHVAMGAPARGTKRGEGVKVAIIDTGVAPHRSLRVHGGKNFILGEPDDGWNQDLEGHGTHCAGIIAALEQAHGTWGWVPAVELFALRVFGGEDGGGYASDIGAAIDWAVAQGCDILNLSLGSSAQSAFLRAKIEKATDAGILCVAAAGNDAQGQVSFPAAFPRVIGVSAVGRRGTYPADSIHCDAESALSSPDGSHYFASFSNHGDAVDFCAPGVAITSTVPGTPGEFSAWDGTSMAAPHVAGLSAVVLQANPAFRARPEARGDLVRDHLLQLCVDLGMSSAHQGAGLLRMST